MSPPNTPERCPYWADGEHCFQTSIEAGADGEHIESAKGCACGEVIERITTPELETSPDQGTPPSLKTGDPTCLRCANQINGGCLDEAEDWAPCVLCGADTRWRQPNPPGVIVRPAAPRADPPVAPPACGLPWCQSCGKHTAGYASAPIRCRLCGNGIKKCKLPPGHDEPALPKCRAGEVPELNTMTCIDPKQCSIPREPNGERVCLAGHCDDFGPMIPLPKPAEPGPAKPRPRCVHGRLLDHGCSGCEDAKPAERDMRCRGCSHCRPGGSQAVDAIVAERDALKGKLAEAEGALSAVVDELNATKR